MKNKNQEQLSRVIDATRQAQNRRQGYQLSETTVLDPNDFSSNIDTSSLPTGTLTRYPANHLQGAGQGEEPRQEDARPRPRQVGRQGERRKQQAPLAPPAPSGGHSNQGKVELLGDHVH